MNFKIYENWDWKSANTKQLKEKLNIILKNIPEGVSTILDAGCGNGFITNELLKKYSVTAVDISEESLKSVKAEKYTSSLDNLPFEDKSFDLVHCSAVLEHLPVSIYKKSINELQRVTKKYLIISVPYDENLELYSVKCPQCKCVFNKSYHVRSYKEQDLMILFPEFKIMKTLHFGKKIRPWSGFMLKAKKFCSSPENWLPKEKEMKEKKILCPLCETNFSAGWNFNIVSIFFDFINLLINKKRPYLILAVYEKTGK